MSHSNTTANYGLPQFITTDKPAWLTDVNVAYNAIDIAMKNNADAASAAQGDASQALLDASAAGTTASTADSKGSGAIASIADTFSTTDTYEVGDLVMYNNLLYKCTVDISVPGPWTGSANWTRETVEGRINTLQTQVDGNTSDISDINTALAGKASKSVDLGNLKIKNVGITFTFNNSAQSNAENLVSASGIALEKIRNVVVYSNAIVPLVCNVDASGLIRVMTYNGQVYNISKGIDVFVVYND